MPKSKKVKKVIPIEEQVMPKEVVLLEDAVEVILKNTCIAIDLIRALSFCESCHGKRE